MPPTVLSAITGRLTSEDLVYLLLCGDSVLLYKLKHGGVEHIWHDQVAWIPFYLPTLVRHFSQVISVSINAQTNNLSFDRRLWDNLPPTLQKIELTTLPSDYYDLITDRSTASKFPHLSTFIGSSRRGAAVPLNWKHLLPSLTDLSLSAPFCEADDSFTLDHIPRSLTRLRASHYPKMTFEGEWPPFLTDLQLYLQPRFTAWNDLFAPLTGLITLKIAISSSREGAEPEFRPPSLENWQALPPNLTDLEWHVYVCSEYTTVAHGVDWNDSMAREAAESSCSQRCVAIFKALPPGLTRFSILPFIEHPETLAHLPSGIRILEGFSLSLNQKTAALLPRSVVALSNLSAPTDAVPFLPPSIDNLTLFRPLLALSIFMEHQTQPHVGTETLADLTPISPEEEKEITAIRRKTKLETAIQMGIEQMASLKDVRLSALTFNIWRFPFSAIGPSLPPTLKDITLSCTLGTENDELPGAVPELTAPDMLHLLGYPEPNTPCLQSLRIRLSLRDPIGLAFLPPSLTKLELTSIKISSAPASPNEAPSASLWSQYLPRNLQRLKMHVVDEAVLTGLEKHDVSLEAETPALYAPNSVPNLEWWKFLPTTMKTIDLQVSHFGIASMKDVAHAMPELSILRIRITMHLDCRWIEDLTALLPRKIEEFCLDVHPSAFIETFSKEETDSSSSAELTPAKHLTVQKPLNIIDSAFLLLPRSLSLLQLKRQGSRFMKDIPHGAPPELRYAANPSTRVVERPERIPIPAEPERVPSGTPALTMFPFSTPVKEPSSSTFPFSTPVKKEHASAAPSLSTPANEPTLAPLPSSTPVNETTLAPLPSSTPVNETTSSTPTSSTSGPELASAAPPFSPPAHDPQPSPFGDKK